MILHNNSEPVSCIEKPGNSGERLIINQSYQDVLSDIGFTSFDAVWVDMSGELIKQKEERSINRVQLPLTKKYEINNYTTADKNTFFYIKKFRQKLNSWQRVKSVFMKANFLPEGLKEFNNYCLFRQNALSTASPVAVGTRFSSSFYVDSFFITQDFSPFVELEEIILRQPETLQGEKNHSKRRNILREIAIYGRRMHDCGMNHKDFNATHILLQKQDISKPLVALFDLQRVDLNPFNRLRWPIKALAELNYTLPSSIFTEEDRVFLYLTYKKKEHLSANNRLQEICIRRKIKKIARHSKKRHLAPKAGSESMNTN
ncbi:MAG: hypothetical protein FP814_03415 [Desulfobacterium sp.]|nr:hypothetical protein [Desulfobacterium sp.]MBU3950034.1 hypothetical protein [Pseudomonadota bacterium]MBU4035737.1 hypothetical protein [Pseudomonadota bacterium]